MPDQTTILSLPHILPSQAQKHVTHNEALRLLDVMVQLSVLQRVLTAPPASPALGDRHIVAPSPSGAWSGQSRKIALWNGSAWEFFTALTGWRAYVEAEATVAVFDGTNWISPSASLAQFAQLGVGMAADATNKLAVQSVASLFTNPAGAHQLAINKGTLADTGSVLFQQGYLSRAEIGLVGNNDLTVKVSPDGTNFFNAMTVEKDTGRTTMTAPLRINPAAGDPAALTDGFLWYNSTTGKFRAKQAGASVDLLAGPPVTVFSDAAFRIEDNLDPTKKAVFQAAAITTATTRTYDLPNASGVIALLGAAQSFTGAQTFTGTASFAGTTTISAPTVVLGNSAAASTVNLGTGATTSGVSKSVSIGTAGLLGSTTTVEIGSAVVGALGATNLRSPSVFLGGTGLNGPATVGTISQLGLGGAVPDATNRFSVNTPAVLLNNAGASIDMTFNKNAVANDASLSFKTGFSTRAIVGTTGSDAFTVKVSADGTSFRDAVVVNQTTALMTGRAAGTVPAVQWAKQPADAVRADVATAQNVFDAAFDVVALDAATTYEFEAEYYITRAAGVVSHTTGVLFGGSAVLTSMEYLAQASNPTGNVLGTVQQIWGTTTGLTVLTAANTSASEVLSIMLKGTVRVTTAGTFIPQFRYSVAPGGAPTVKRNSTFRIWPVGSNTAGSAGSAWS